MSNLKMKIRILICKINSGSSMICPQKESTKEILKNWLLALKFYIRILIS